MLQRKQMVNKYLGVTEEYDVEQVRVCWVLQEKPGHDDDDDDDYPAYSHQSDSHQVGI